MAAKSKKKGKVVGKVVGELNPNTGGKAGKPSSGGWTQPKPAAKSNVQRPPAGYYDPALDSALSASKRGLGDLKSDYSRDFGDGSGGRMGNDFQLGLEALGVSRDRGMEDLGAQRADVNTASAREGEDWQTALANLNRQYQQLGTVQAQGDRRAGVTSQGLLDQQARIRASNQALDRAPLDTAHARAGQDTATALGRLDTAGARVGQDFDTGSAQLGLGFQRAQEDASTNVARSGREVTQFGVDTQASRLYQATQAGYTPPASSGGGGSRSPGAVAASQDAARAASAAAAAAKQQAAALQAGTVKRRRRSSRGNTAAGTGAF